MTETSRNILVVDDDGDFAESIADILEFHGHQPVIANSGEEAVEVFKNNKFDLVFLDVQMPGKNGVESFLEMRKIEPRVHAVIMTGYSVPELLETAFINGALGVLNKPLDVDQLLEYVDNSPQPCVALLVDSDPDFTAKITTILTDEGLNVQTVANPKEAMATLSAPGMVDLLLVDLQNSTEDRLAFCHEIRKLDVKLQIILISPSLKDGKVEFETFEDMAATKVLPNSFEPDELVALIRARHQGNGGVDARG